MIVVVVRDWDFLLINCAVLTHSGGCTSEKKSYRYFCVQFAGTNQNVSIVPHLSADPCSVGVQPV